MGWVKRHKNLETVMLMTEPIFTSLHADHSAGRGAAPEGAAPFVESKGTRAGEPDPRRTETSIPYLDL
jgi:hypothetical protein